MPRKPTGAQPDPETVLASLVARFDPAVQACFRSVRSALRRRFPAANELAYDYGSHVVVSYAPGDRGIDAIVSIDARLDGVRLYLSSSDRLPDPAGLLQGTGKLARFVPLGSADRLQAPGVDALIRAATSLATVPMPAEGIGRLIVKPVAGGRRSRRDVSSPR